MYIPHALIEFNDTEPIAAEAVSIAEGLISYTLNDRHDVSAGSTILRQVADVVSIDDLDGVTIPDEHRPTDALVDIWAVNGDVEQLERFAPTALLADDLPERIASHAVETIAREIATTTYRRGGTIPIDEAHGPDEAGNAFIDDAIALAAERGWLTVDGDTLRSRWAPR